MKIIFLSLLFLISCSQETLTTGSQKDSTGVASQVTTNLQSCAQMQLDKPPVDILYVIDNSGSSLSGEFQSIKSSIANTINSVSNEFDFHIYLAPLFAPSGSNIHSYPLIVSNVNGLNSQSLNIKSIDSLTSNDIFASATGNNFENGLERARLLVSNNRSNGIFRNNAHTIIVMVSNGNDTTTTGTIDGQPYVIAGAYENHRDQYFSLKNSLSAQSMRFISLVAHQTNCKPGYQVGTEYMKLSNDIYNSLDPIYQNDSDRDTKNLCTNNISSVFSSINSTIRSVVTGHKYDHWLISTKTESEIQQDDIKLYKILTNGSQVEIPQSSSNGFEYLGARTNQNTRYFPTAGAPVTGLVVKLNGQARIEYPECVVAQTKTPIEYYGWAVISRKPIENTIIVRINGQDITKSTSNGWSYDGYRDSQNIKINHNGASNQPGDYRSGYFIKLNGDAIISNGDNVEIFFTPAPI